MISLTEELGSVVRSEGPSGDYSANRQQLQSGESQAGFTRQIRSDNEWESCDTSERIFLLSTTRISVERFQLIIMITQKIIRSRRLEQREREREREVFRCQRPLLGKS